MHSRPAFPQEQELQLPLHVHLTSSLVHLATSGMVIQRGVHFPLSFFQPNSDGEGKLGIDDVTIQIPEQKKDDFFHI